MSDSDLSQEGDNRSRQVGVTEVCDEYISRYTHGETFTLEQAFRKLTNQEERLAALSDLLPFLINQWQKEYGRLPCCEELALAHPDQRDEICHVYEKLESDLRLPQRFGSYRVVKLLCGNSSQGMVLKARDDGISKDVAIKCSAHQASRDRIRAEAHILQTLKDSNTNQHSSLIQVITILEEQGFTALILDYIPGETLYRAGRVEAREAVKMIAAVAKDLGDAHRLGICHQDISFNNIMLTPAREPVIIDFGMAVQRDSWTDATTELTDWGGTPQFFAPERYLNQSEYNIKLSEIYSLGALLYWLITDELPNQDGLAEHSHQQDLLTYDAEKLSNCTAQFKQVRGPIIKAMAFLPEDRFQSAGEFHAALQASLSDYEARILKPRNLVWGTLITLALFAAYLVWSEFASLKETSLEKEQPHLVNTKTDGTLNSLATGGPSSPVVQQALQNALSTADVSSLKQFTEAGLSIQALELALKTEEPSSKSPIAEVFFQGSRSNKAATGWFAQMLESGLDPNLLVSTDGSTQVSLLHLALKVGNADTTLALLHAGASPHPYSTLLGSRLRSPQFLFPLWHLPYHGFSQIELTQITQAMVNNGLYIPDPAETDQAEESPFFGLQANENSLVKLSKQLNVELNPTVSLWVDPTSPIAAAATRTGPHDWNQFLIDMPKSFVEIKHVDNDIRGASISSLLAIHEDRAYFMGNCEHYGNHCVVFTTTYNSPRWTMFIRYRALSGSHGVATPIPGDRYPDKDQSDRWWWRGIHFQYDAERREMSYESQSSQTKFRAYRSKEDISKPET